MEGRNERKDSCNWTELGFPVPSLSLKHSDGDLVVVRALEVVR